MDRLPAATAFPPPLPCEGSRTRTSSSQDEQTKLVGLCKSFREGWAQSSRRPCQFAAAGCCAYGADCYYSHSNEEELNNRGSGIGVNKKKDVCTYFALGIGCKKGGGKCKNAHGDEELESRPPPFTPPFFSKVGLKYSDTHCHLDGILLVRKWGQNWHYKTKPCRDYMEEGRQCYYTDCLYAHGDYEIRPRPLLEKADAVDFAKFLPKGFAGLVHICCDKESIEDAVALVQWGREVLGGKIYASFGLHPSDHFEYTDELEALLLDGFDRCGDRAIAWGECGLDYYRKPKAEEKVHMRRVLVRQVRLAVERNLPLVIHSRDAEDDTFEVLREHLPRSYRVHLHSFAGSVRTLAKFLEDWPRCYFGVNGLVTYPTTPFIVDLVRHAPLNRILLETDGPFMIPEPFRYNSWASHAGHIPWIAQRVAEIKNMSPEVVLAQIHVNFCAMYGIDSGSE